MKKIVFTLLVAGLFVISSCSTDKSNNCACSGALGTNFSGPFADSLCTVWQGAMCPKTWTCTCTLGAPASVITDQDSLSALSTCAYTQSQLQHMYPGTTCAL